MKQYKDINVLEASKMRIEYIFDNFENIYFSVSGGKDSSAMIQIVEEVAKIKNRKYDVLFIDMEAQYKLTIEHINEIKKLENIRDFYHICLPLYLRNAVTILEPKWICWDEKVKEKWVRELPEDSININNNIFDFYKKPIEFEEFIILFAEWYQKKYKTPVATGVGIRTNESFNRFRTIISESKVKFNGKSWTTKIRKNAKYLECYNFYPIFDFETQDIWKYLLENNCKINKIYELMMKNGLSIHEQRLCQPFGDDQKNGLDQFKALEFETWEKLLNRVAGVNFGNIYARTTALGNIKTNKPKNISWEQYSVILLEVIGQYNKELQKHYVSKIKKFIQFYIKNEIIKNEKDIKDEEDLKLESAKKVISWRRIARALEKNDFYMKGLSFSQNKSDTEKLLNMMEKYNNILNSKTETTYKYLKELIK